MTIKQFFEDKGYSDVEIIDERAGLHNFVYTIKKDSELFFYKKPKKESDISETLSPERVFNEWTAMKLAKKVIPEHVPEIFHFDKGNHILITKGPHKKSSILRFDLLDGKLDLELVRKLAQALKNVHSVKTDDLSREMFDEVKINFIYKPLGEKYPEVARKLIENINEKKCMVHADFNPKNIVVFEDSFLLIDWEQALMSSPEQDIGNMLGHYVIKGIHLGREDYLKVPEVFLEAYGDGVDRNLINGHIGATLWCRVHTAAKAQYLTTETREKVAEEAEKYLKEFKV